MFIHQKLSCFFLVFFLLFIPIVLSAQTVKYDVVDNGFNSPIDIQFAGDDRIFVVEQDGLIKIIENGVTRADPFLNLTGVTDSYGEQGLLGLAFHPLYSENGYFFVNYTRSDGNTVISRFTVSADANIANPNSEKIILIINQPFSNHNGGCLRFGPDEYLYIGMGDGGSGGDPLGNGQLRTTMLGKMLRIDIDTDQAYVIPPSNPFSEDDFTLDEIWALGLRNPWRFSFDMVTGDLWIGDVGQNLYEEIDFQPSNSMGGENYGWRCKEGEHPFNLEGCPDEASLTDPVLTIDQGPDCSITGGYVYRGTNIPELLGGYVFGDFCSGRVYTLINNNGTWETDRLPNVNNPSSFGQDSNGEMYIADYSSGEILKIANIISATDEKESESVSIQVYPNPTTDLLYLSFNNALLSNNRLTNVSIIHSDGIVVYALMDIIKDDLTLSTKDWPAGLYTIRFMIERVTTSTKFIKMN